jgi:hypothetical protein
MPEYCVISSKRRRLPAPPLPAPGGSTDPQQRRIIQTDVLQNVSIAHVTCCIRPRQLPRCPARCCRDDSLPSSSLPPSCRSTSTTRSGPRACPALLPWPSCLGPPALALLPWPSCPPALPPCPPLPPCSAAPHRPAMYSTPPAAPAAPAPQAPSLSPALALQSRRPQGLRQGPRRLLRLPRPPPPPPAAQVQLGEEVQGAHLLQERAQRPVRRLPVSGHLLPGAAGGGAAHSAAQQQQQQQQQRARCAPCLWPGAGPAAASAAGRGTAC